MSTNSYHCKYCHQRKPTETALNRHIAHSAVCFQAYQDDLLRLTCTNIGINPSVNRRSANMDDLVVPDSLVDDSNIEVEMSKPDRTGPAQKKKEVPSIRRSEETEEEEDVDGAHSRNRYRRSYPGGYTVEILGKGQTKFQIWQEEQRLHGENEWV
jgi:hypothetical protein